MKALVIYDSLYGNTEKIAKAIGGAITGEVKVLPVGQANPAELKSLDLLIVGSPTQGGRATKAMQAFLDIIPDTSLKGINVAAFDTRYTSKFAVIFGYAAGRIAGNLKAKGGTLVAPPEGFFVTGNKGPLKEGELERAAGWARGIAESKK
ncbi:MAG: flavodoxin family protein [Dehalococcoidales bacterium]|nr:flavodoxin family protein [Dehalococcoidales bacterium]